jgi:hypothetical protein
MNFIRRHSIALLALFLAAGGGGAYAASLGNGKISGFAKTVSRNSSSLDGTLVKMNGLALKYDVGNAEDERPCQLIAKPSSAGTLGSFYGVKGKGVPKDYSIGARELRKGGNAPVVRVSFDPGAPGVERQVVGQLTWRTGNRVATVAFHLAAEENQCRFDGTVTGAG